MRAVYADELEPATIAVSTSGAPFANARKVTPAIASDMPSLSYIYATCE